MNILTDEKALISFIARADTIGMKDYATLLHFFASNKYEPIISPPPNPDSYAYKEWQLNLWKAISGRTDYVPHIDEACPDLTLAEGASNPFPYCTHDPVTIGNYLSAIGNIIKCLELRQGDSLIEFGVGWGHTTVNLARCGYSVTAVDIEKKFLDIVRYRSCGEPFTITTCHGDFLDFPCQQAQYDAALFFECFHHCLNFKELLTKIRFSLKPGGRIIFCAESFYDDFEFPWGVRLDGHSVWAMRKFGWMELGFNTSFIVNLIKSLGFKVEKKVFDCGAYGNIFIAKLT